MADEPAGGAARGSRARRAAELALGLAFLAVVAFSFANVVLRNLFEASLIYADEVQVLALVALAFIGAVVVSARDAHLRMDLAAAALPPGPRAGLRAVEALVTAAACGFAAWQSWTYAAQMHRLGRRAEMIDLPTWPFHVSLAVGFLGMALLALRHFVRVWRRGRTPAPPASIPSAPPR